MAPVNTMTPPSMPDDLRRELESTISPVLHQSAEATFHSLDKESHLEMSQYPDAEEAGRHIVSSETAYGEPISARDLFSSDQAYELAEEAAKEQLERVSLLRNIGKRLDMLRDNF